MQESTHQLISKQQDSLQREASVAEIEEILQRRSQKIDDHSIVIAFNAIPPHKGYTDTTSESLREEKASARQRLYREIDIRSTTERKQTRTHLVHLCFVL